MKNKNEKLEAAKAAFVRKIERLYPVARGTVSLVRKPCNRPNCPLCKSGEKHQALIYTCRIDGVGKCFHVRPEDEKLMRKAVENAKKLEALLASEGLKYLDILRGED